MSDAPSFIPLANVPFDRLPARYSGIARFTTRLLIAARLLEADQRGGKLHPGRLTPQLMRQLIEIADGEIPLPIPPGWPVTANRRHHVRNMLAEWVRIRQGSAKLVAATREPPPPTKAKAKRKARPKLPARHADTGPDERWKHGEFEQVDAFEIDAKEVKLSGTLVRRSVDTLARLVRSGAIDQAQLDAGRRFGAAYSAAGMTLRSVDFQPKSKSTVGDGYQAHLAGRRQSVGAAITMLGGEGSEMAQAIIQVCGEGKSLREWAKQPRPHRPEIHEKVAQGILRSALAALASHYGKRD